MPLAPGSARGLEAASPALLATSVFGDFRVKGTLRVLLKGSYKDTFKGSPQGRYYGIPLRVSMRLPLRWHWGELISRAGRRRHTSQRSDPLLP